MASVQVALLRFFHAPYTKLPVCPQKVLIVKLDELGDVAMMLPFITALKNSLPNASITLALNHQVAGLFEGASDVRVLSVDVACNKIFRPLVLPIRHYLFVRRELGDQEFDLCFVPRRDADDVYATVLAYFTNSPRRISFSENSTPRKSWLNRGFNSLLTDAISVPSVQHETLSNISLLRAAGLPTPAVSDFARLRPWVPQSSQAETFACRVLPDSPQPYVALCPTSGHSPLKQWGGDRFADVAVRLAKSGCRIVLVGGPGDADLGTAIEAVLSSDCINLIGKTTLSQLTAVLGRCTAFVGNDAGPMHIASALGINTAAVFGSSCWHMFGPWGRNSLLFVHQIACSPCQTHKVGRCQTCIHSETLCLRKITADAVATGVLVTISNAQLRTSST
jgi:heptosyltransferase-2